MDAFDIHLEESQECREKNPKPMVVHKSGRDPVKNTVCDICFKRFASVKTLRAHIAGVHVKDESRMFKCEICDYKNLAKNRLTKHMSHVHKIGDTKKFACVQCDKNFNFKANLKQHVQKVHGEVFDERWIK